MNPSTNDSIANEVAAALAGLNTPDPEAVQEIMAELRSDLDTLHVRASALEANTAQEPAPAADQERLRAAFFKRLRAIVRVVADLTAEQDALAVKLQAEVVRLQGQHAPAELAAEVERFYEIPALNIQAILEIYNLFGSGPAPEQARELKALIAAYTHQLGQRAGWRSCGYLLPGVFLPLPDAPKEAEKPRTPQKPKKSRARARK